MSDQHRPPGPTTHVRRAVQVDSGVSPKRRKLEHAKNAAEEPQLSSANHTASVKPEPSPSPPPSLALRTSGTVRINIPDECLKTRLDWKEKRAKWVAVETSKLRDLGLKVPKRLIREDGLALDWVSSVPVCPLTLRPPSPVLSIAQAPQPKQAQDLGNQPPGDLLGHALHDQLVSSRQSNISGGQPSVHIQPDVPLQNGRELLPQNPNDDASVLSDFTVVGAATHKKLEDPAPKRAPESASAAPAQWDHRKLLPPDLRPGKSRFVSKGGAKEQKARRLAWIAKEIEKVEGYTGEKVGGFRYDGNDVIISLSKAVYRARINEAGGPISVGPPRLDRRWQPRTYNAPPTGLQAVRINGPPGPPPIASLPNNIGGPIPSCSRAPEKLSLATTAGETSTPRPTVPIPPPNLHVVKQPAPPRSASISTPPLLDRTSSQIESTSRNSEAVTQARGLGFLERYLQLFDSDREALALAYTPNATFSLTEEKYDNTTNHLAAANPGQLPQVVKTGRLEIVDTLKKILPNRQHSPSADIAYNIATLDDMSTGGLLLTCEGTLIPLPVDPPPVAIVQNRRRHPWPFSRIFVLKQNDDGGGQAWPLQIAAERLTVQKRVK